MKTQPFGQRIAHGTMVFAIGVGLTASRINPAAFSYGYDRLRFVKPVFIGDTIRTRLAILRKEPDPKRPHHGRVWELTEVINQRDEVVLACEHLYVVQRRPDAVAAASCQARACSHYFGKCERGENRANLGARRSPDWPSGLGVQRRVALF